MPRLTGAIEAVDELLAQPGHDLMAVAVVQGEQQVDEAHRCQPAERARAFDEPRRRAATRRGNRGSDAGGAATEHEHIRPADDRNVARGLMQGVHTACCRVVRGDAEQDRLDADREGTARWKWWGPYVAARQWGTVREDYSAGGTAWEYFPHDHARSRAYRWGE